MGNVDCIGCHQLGQESTRTIPAQFGEFKTGADAWMRRISSGQTGEFMVEPDCRTARRRAVQVFRRLDRPRRQGRAAARASRRGRRASSATSSSRRGSGARRRHFTHDLISSDRRNPTVNAYGPLYGSAEYSSDDIPILDPKTHKVTFFKMSVADPNAPESFGPPFHASAVVETDAALGLLGRRENLEPARQQPQRHVRQEGPGVVCRGRARESRIQPSARRARTIPRPRCSRSTSRGARWRCSIPRR